MVHSSRLVTALCAFSYLAASGADGTWKAREGIGTGGTNLAVWNEVANWVDDTVASGSDAVATLTPAAGRYVKLPDSLSLKTILNDAADAPVVIIGDGSYDFNPRDTNQGPKNCFLYCPFDFSVNGEANSNQYAGFMRGCQICGPIGSQTAGGYPRFEGTVSFRYDLYATAAGENRTFQTFPSAISMDSGATLRFISPKGSSTALSSRWMQTAGSPFLALAAGETPHTLSAGTIVTGDGIPSGTFLKRIFPDGSIELSASPTSTVAGNALTFAAFNGKTYATLPYRMAYFNSAGWRTVIVEKYRDEDEFTVKIPRFQTLSSGNYRWYKFTTEEGFLPGKIEFGYVQSDYSPVVFLENCHLQIEDDTAINGAVSIRMSSAAHTTRLTVTNGVSHTFGRITELAGTLVKDGAGTLVMGMPTSSATAITGAIVIDQGTFAPTFVDAGTNEIASLTIRSGAKFVIPEGVVLKPTSLVVEEGAVFGGLGRLVYPFSASDLAGLVLEDGVSVDDGRFVANFSIDVLRGTPTMSKQNGDRVLIFETNALIRVNGTGLFDVLVVGGGGGGGSKCGGGGGGGGVVYTQSLAVASGIYSVTVGRGGIGAPDKSTVNTSGGDSGAFGILAYGGGAGGTFGGRTNSHYGLDGGSGGGGGIVRPWNYATRAHGGTGLQGHDGGSGCNINFMAYGGASYVGSAYRSTGGGGGGAGGAGVAADYQDDPERVFGGNGGAGVLCEIYGAVYYGGGGGGGATSRAESGSFTGGIGGGGDGGVTVGSTVKPGKNGTDGLGGGGGGGSGDTADSEGGAGGNGGSGVVIIRYHIPPRGFVLTIQ